MGLCKPFDNDSEVLAKCTDCFKIEKEEINKNSVKPLPGERKEITLENGMKGFLTVAGPDTAELSFWDLMVSGKKFYCAKDRRESFYEYLNMIDNDQVDITFFHSSSIILPPGNSRKKNNQKQAGEKKKNSLNYNCTITVPKYYALNMFDNIAKRAEDFVEVLAKAVVKAEADDCGSKNMGENGHQKIGQEDKTG